MRETKFRVWDKIEKKWLVGAEALEVYWINNKLILHVGIEYARERNQSEFVIMQFTGHEDKKGKDIFEGDILSFLEGRYKVCWSERGAMFFTSMLTKIEVTKFCNTESWDKATIIGNEYENPKLLIK